MVVDVEPWFDRLRTWVEVAVDQDADRDTPIRSVWRPRSSSSLFQLQPGLASRLANLGIGTVMRHDFESVSLPRLRKAAALANAGEMPSDAHLLLRDARVALRRGKLVERRLNPAWGAAVAPFGAGMTFAGLAGFARF